MLRLIEIVAAVSSPVECVCRINDFFEGLVRVNSTLVIEVLEERLQEHIVVTISDCERGSQRFRCDPNTFTLEAMDRYGAAKSTTLVLNLQEVVKKTVFTYVWILLGFVLLCGGIYHKMRVTDTTFNERVDTEVAVCKKDVQETYSKVTEDEIFKEVEKFMHLPDSDVEWRDFFEQIYKNGFWEQQNNSNNKDL